MTAAFARGKSDRISVDLPLVIETIDSEDEIRGFLSALEPMMTCGLVT